ncbi:FtsK/SpoIIIE domain-containing protein [Kribbella sp. NPDC051718]|uniref:FtsK/SpoIIIE domain-containing protein n=1 Tax=Kribbella sp. NPDC051718 TaxID=3155168 RepID=UPI00343C6AA8
MVIYTGRPEGGIYDMAYAFGSLFGVFFRYRSELAPAYWWAGCLLVGAWAHAAHPGAWFLPVITGVAGLGVLAVPPHAVLARWPLLGRWRVRLWAAGFTIAVAGFLGLATAHGATAGELPTYGFLLAGGLGLPWWWREDRRRLSKVRLIRERFPDTAESAGLAGARMLSAVVGKWGWTARLRLRRGQHYADAVTALPALESALGARVGSLRVEAVSSDAAEVVLRLVETDPHAEPIPWVARPGKRPASIKDPFTVGVWEDGTDVSASMLRKHVLIGGATDSGKSGLLNVILGRLAECSDAIVWGIDLKEGMELAPWAKVLNLLATNNDQAAGLLRAGVAELERRAAFLAEQGIREWTPTSSAPALVIMIDEYAELSPAARKLADSIARRGRAVAVTLLVATQRPTQKTMGDGSAIRSQMNIRFCLRVVERGDVDLILGAGSLTAGWDTTGFDAPGKFLMRAPGHDTPRRARAQWINNGDVRATANRNARPDHHDPNRPQDTTGDDTDPDPAQNTADATNGAQNGSQTPATASVVSGPDVALWEALKQAPPTGAAIAELMTATGQSKTALYRRLQALRTQGRADQVSRGRWRATPRPHNPRDPGTYTPAHP